MQKFQKRSKRNLVVSFGLGLAVLLLSSGLSYFSIRQLLDSQDWVEHTVQVRSALDNLISEMKDAETGQRGFLLTGDNSFLEPYNGSKEKVQNYFAQVQRLTIDNQSQQHDLPLLEKLVEEKFAIIDQTIADKRRGIPPVVGTLLHGKAIMDSVRVVVKVMNEREDKLMVARNAKMDKFAAFTPIAVVIAAIIGMLITFVFYRRVQNDVRIAAALEQELINKQKSVEKQIETIANVANKLSSGDYQVRINKDELK